MMVFFIISFGITVQGVSGAASFAASDTNPMLAIFDSPKGRKARILM
jgi:hypothetical protein